MKALLNKKILQNSALALILAFAMTIVPMQKVNATAQTPITRSQAEQRALSMINLNWTYSASQNGTMGSEYAAYVTRPAQLENLTSGQLTGIPYDWGGLDSQYSTSYDVPWTSFIDAINQGAYAGNVNIDAGLGYIPGTAGIDCSGFVQATFNIKDSKISTSTIFNTYFKKIALSDIRHMDILDKPGDHVVIFDRWGTLNGVSGAFTYESTPDQTRGGIQGTKKYFISLDEINNGYIPGRYIYITEDSAETTISKGVFAQVSGVVSAASLRSSPDYNSQQIGTVPKGTFVYLIDSKYGWFQVSYGGRTGWIWGQFVSSIPEGKYVTVNNVSLLNIRANPTTSAQIVGTIGKNQYAEVLAYSSDGKWLKISINGIQGWASGTYLRYIY